MIFDNLTVLVPHSDLTSQNDEDLHISALAATVFPNVALVPKSTEIVNRPQKPSDDKVAG